ncbi:class I SAM-dependent methyltransferase [Altererythrobacter lauratis]|uniref:Class I SAM-dependent methyltransferase n=1 Tax=Alteraurantiacibacter lauratis TaxID=2054627 RepID=A0ABV7EES0_9SPHN
MSDQSFTPALGWLGSVGIYDRAIRLLTREQVWRAALLRQVAPQAGELILDVGCGTGTFAIMLKRLCPAARVVALDPDSDVLRIASRKGMEAGVSIEWRQGFATDAEALGATADKAVSSLVFHQVPMAGKRAGIAAMFAAVRQGGEVHIADYASQSSFMRAMFRLTVQQIDGVADTQPNADGALEAILSNQSGAPVGPTRAIPTPTGAISLFKVQKPGSL